LENWYRERRAVLIYLAHADIIENDDASQDAGREPTQAVSAGAARVASPEAPQAVSAGAREIPNAGRYFLIAHDIILRNALAECKNLGAAGNEELATRCENETRNAHNYLLDRANHSRVTDVVWGLCGRTINADLSMGARCITAGEHICKLGLNNELLNYMQCMQVMSSGAWIANPEASALDFSGPVK
jgi:hypothetical protein